MPHATGWAVLNNLGEIVVSTVSPNRITAIVNWLMAERQVRVFPDTKESIIEECWAKLSAVHGCAVAPVTITAPLRGVR